MADTSRHFDVQKIAALARLTLSSEEASRFAPQLERVLDHIAQLEEVDTSSVEATSHVVALSTPLRNDVVREGLSRDEALSQAPRAAEGAFVVPKFVEGG